MGEAKLLQMSGISKSFGPNQVLKGVDLTVEKGKVVAVNDLLI